jgi:hypothetical protein
MTSYRYAPRPLGKTVTATLAGGNIAVADGLKTQAMPLAEIAAIRLSFAPTNTFGRSFTARLIFVGGRTLTIVRRDGILGSSADAQDYAGFIAALCRQASAANPACRFQAGQAKVRWIPLAVLSAGAVLMAGGLAAKSWFDGRGWAMSALLTLLAGLLIAMMAEMTWRNRPRGFSPEAPPADLLGGPGERRPPS